MTQLPIPAASHKSSESSLEIEAVVFSSKRDERKERWTWADIGALRTLAKREQASLHAARPWTNIGLQGARSVVAEAITKFLRTSSSGSS